MSLVSLLVGMFLIYNTIEASVVRRRNEIGILRSLGATRTEVRCAFSRGGGRPRRDRNRGRAGRRIFARARARRDGRGNDLVALRPAQRARGAVSRHGFGAARCCLGLASVLAAAWLPARAAAALNPVETLHHGGRVEQSVRLSRGWIFAGGSSLLLSLACSRSWRCGRVRRGSVSGRRFLSLPVFLRSRRKSRRASVARCARRSISTSSCVWLRKISVAPCSAMRSRLRRWPRRWR